MPKIIHNGITYAGLPDIDYDCEITTVTLYAANWSDGVYTISDARIDATSVQEYMPGLGITDTQLEALQAANIHDFGQDAGHAYLKAYGDTPEIDIPIRIMFNPGVKTKEVENKLDVYSTEETIIGTWIDGRTIYRRYFSLTSSVVISATSWTAITDFPLSDYYIIKAYGCDSTVTVWMPLQVRLRPSETYAKFTTGANDLGCDNIILEYVKPSELQGA